MQEPAGQDLQSGGGCGGSPARQDQPAGADGESRHQEQYAAKPDQASSDQLCHRRRMETEAKAKVVASFWWWRIFGAHPSPSPVTS